MKYLCDDGNCEMEIDAESSEEAAQEYVDGGEWGDRTQTQWITVYVRDPNNEDPTYQERFNITLEPDEPSCEEGENHDWVSPYELLGGLKENPGVWGHGGGVIIKEVCAHCGKYRVTDTWAQDNETGEQGLTSIEYRDADDDSLTWIDRQAVENEQRETIAPPEEYRQLIQCPMCGSTNEKPAASPCQRCAKYLEHGW